MSSADLTSPDLLRGIRDIAHGAPSDYVLSTVALCADDQTRLRRAAAAPAGTREKALRREYPADLVDAALTPSVATPTATPAGLPPTPPPELSEEALHGPLGDHVRLVEPHTEAHPAAILVQDLVAAGAAIGRGPHLLAEATEHHACLFAVVVGKSAKARKGTSLGHVLRLWQRVDSTFAERVKSGLSSGEGLIYAVRDPALGTDKNGEPCVADAGVPDKRVCVLEGEFAVVLSQGKRDGNILSAVLRDAWDGRRLSVLTKSSPITASNAHITIAAHITSAELQAMLDKTSALNGFANRFLWVHAHRTRLLPHGSDGPNPADLVRLETRIRDAVQTARTQGRLRWDREAADLWTALYAAMAEERDDLVGSVTARGEAQTLRLSLLYALLDGASVVRAEHLRAAYAVWRYCAASAAFIFSDADPVRKMAEDLLRTLRSKAPEGLPRTAMHDTFSRNEPAERIDAALKLLTAHGLARADRHQTGGRPSEIWRAC